MTIKGIHEFIWVFLLLLTVAIVVCSFMSYSKVYTYDGSTPNKYVYDALTEKYVLHLTMSQERYVCWLRKALSNRVQIQEFPSLLGQWFFCITHVNGCLKPLLYRPTFTIGALVKAPSRAALRGRVLWFRGARYEKWRLPLVLWHVYYILGHYLRLAVFSEDTYNYNAFSLTNTSVTNEMRLKYWNDCRSFLGKLSIYIDYTLLWIHTLRNSSVWYLCSCRHS